MVLQNLGMKISLITPNKPICLLRNDNVVFVAEEQKFLGDNNAIFVVKQKKVSFAQLDRENYEGYGGCWHW